ncbi:kinase-like domain-containing protein [Rhizophagus diaphanus]|nr:kinase-like domain-containing protein [Rhizophagus diaphanus] [Rhizophagus sp. MUCL 43196]
MIVEYANGGRLDDYISNHVVNWDWVRRLCVLYKIIKGLKKIHENKMIHRDFHTGNILIPFTGNNFIKICISDMGLCGEVSNIDEKNIYGVMPFVAPEVLKSKRYTPAADIYSFGMIMYFIMTSKQPFADCAHDSILAIKICSGTRPDINELEAPKCYIDLMKRGLIESE